MSTINYKKEIIAFAQHLDPYMRYKAFEQEEYSSNLSGTASYDTLSLKV